MAKAKQFRNQGNHEGITHRIFDDVVDVASTLFRNRKAVGAEKLHALAEATREYAASMTDLPTLQRQVNFASENIGNFAEYVFNTDIKHMVSDATVLARRRPLLTLGVALTAGLAATRFMTSNATPPAPTKRRTKGKTTKQRAVAKRTLNGSAHANP